MTSQLGFLVKKRCSECKDEKEDIEFYRDPRNGQPRSICKKCFDKQTSQNKRRKRENNG